MTSRSLTKTRLASDKEQKAHNTIYRSAILKALEKLHDFHTRSSIDAIRKLVQSLLPDDLEWNNTLFLRTLKDTIANGDLEAANTGTPIFCKLSQELKKKRAEDIESMMERQRRHQQESLDLDIRWKNVGADWKEVPKPKRHSIHAKPKIIPKRIMDKALISNPMETI
mmetsp:Transcript_19793/g.30561  ORF Transcript_19793/g.30561 Transcript_19793/m.30561 type:complete len:168 (-) Transcript_19793:336-839(-)|eukprot:CAMPEP_0195290126 /NCGR_PEP_ID=MMETSP0707-20130614/6113_1 /TAXON_ID=33640 /ORGANISM="Asterionellopsis glacialis, Strain CCMP134" /LENGTH=167 /DNA_ID=CAMNT_0040350207 /DNA_START=198 /DNA_END=701 /DNA_ORIENTATION=+